MSDSSEAASAAKVADAGADAGAVFDRTDADGADRRGEQLRELPDHPDPRVALTAKLRNARVRIVAAAKTGHFDQLGAAVVYLTDVLIESINPSDAR